jgi:ketosteroid isomerase-like protein
MAASEFDQFIRQYHRALDDFCLRGNPESAKALYSHGDDASLGNPFGPVGRGWQQVSTIMDRAAANYTDGEQSSYERVAECATPQLRYIVEVEQYKTRVGGSEDRVTVSLRVTTVFRPEDGTWKIVHRHADPITTAQPAESVMR